MNAAPDLRVVQCDLVLVHAPAFFDFRGRRDVYFPYLSTSGDVPITPLYEYFPMGFKALQRALGDDGQDVQILNLSSALLAWPDLDVRGLLGALRPRIFGIDLHWMVHVQGALAVARLLKELHPDVPVVFGGISSTYYARELVTLPGVDMVMRGYDTLGPMRALMAALGDEAKTAAVPNLLWTDRRGEVVDNGFTHTPTTYGCGLDWSRVPSEAPRGTLPIREILSTQHAGCAYNCGWCGGSKDAFQRINGVRHPMARKPMEEVAWELDTLRRMPSPERNHFYAVGSYCESPDRLDAFLDGVASAGLGSISYEQHKLTSEPVLRRMVEANPRTVLTLSPESHDRRVAKLAGRGLYSNEEMEEWIERALEIGIHQIDIWYFIGMPEQDERSVHDTLAYCGHLLERFRGQRVTPLLCPMIPFLDPACAFFEEPDRHGYRLFARTAAEHERIMTHASLIRRVNYETRWLSRGELVRVGYEAVRELTERKAGVGLLGRGVARSVRAKSDDALDFMAVVHEADGLRDPRDRARALDDIGDEILRRNDQLFYGGVSNQAFPIPRKVGGRWFDELIWSVDELAAFAGEGAEVTDEVA